MAKFANSLQQLQSLLDAEGVEIKEPEPEPKPEREPEHRNPRDGSDFAKGNKKFDVIGDVVISKVSKREIHSTWGYVPAVEKGEPVTITGFDGFMGTDVKTNKRILGADEIENPLREVRAIAAKAAAEAAAEAKRLEIAATVVETSLEEVISLKEKVRATGNPLWEKTGDRIWRDRDMETHSEAITVKTETGEVYYNLVAAEIYLQQLEKGEEPHIRHETNRGYYDEYFPEGEGKRLINAAVQAAKELLKR